MKVYQQVTTGKLHRKRTCGISSRTRYLHVEREMSEAEISTHAPGKCQKCFA
jgi:hypothetical protein